MIAGVELSEAQVKLMRCLQAVLVTISLRLQKLLRSSKSFMKVDEMREAFFEFDIDGDGTITTKVSTLQNDFLSDPSPIIGYACHSLTD